MTHPGREGGITGPGSLQLSGKESISLFSGKLAFNIPLLTIGGRGTSGYTMNLRIMQQWRMFNGMDTTYEPPVERLFPHPSWWEPIEVGYGPGVLMIRTGAHDFRTDCGRLAQRILTRLTFLTPDGSEHSFRDVAHDGKPSVIAFGGGTGCTTSGHLNRGRIFKAYDGTAMTFISDTDIVDTDMVDAGTEYRELSGFLFFADGTRYRVSRGVVDWISDRNGNVTSFTYEESAGCSKCRVLEVRDPLRRKVTISYGSGSGPDVITYRGAQGGTRTITVNWGIPYSGAGVANPDILYRAYTPKKLSHNMQVSLFGGADVAFLDFYMSDLVVSSLVLANGDTYSFQYNEYSELAKVTLPTGGGYLYEHEGGLGGGNHVGTFIYRRLKNRKEFTGHVGNLESISGTTTFGYSFTAGGPSSTVTVARSQGDSGAAIDEVKHRFRGSPQPVGSASPISYPYSDEGQEYETEVNDLSVTPNRTLKKITHTHFQRTPVTWWANTPVAQRVQQDKEPTNDIRVGETKTTVDWNTPSAKVYRESYGYDDYNNRTSTYSYGFDQMNPSLIRWTEVTFLKSYAGRDYDSVGNYNASATNVAERVANVFHIRSLPRQISVNNMICEVSRETFDYDQTASADRSDATQRLHEIAPTLYPGGDPYGTSFLARGNATLVTKALSYSGSLSGSCVGAAGVGTARTYDILGNMTSLTNPRSQTTNFDYTDNFDGDTTDKGSKNTWAFVKEETNALGHKVKAFYDYNLGLPASRIDPNSRSTTFTYDLLGRISLVSLPDGGGAQYFYDAANGTITTWNKRTSSSSVISDTVFDGLGRPCETRLNEGTATIRTRTEYDGGGRAIKISNPYRIATPGRCAAGSGEVWTERTYDALDRVLKVTAPDGSKTETQFLGEKTTLIDAAERKRELTTDELGRLTQVVEDPGGTLAYTTYYRYDGNGKLTGVCPGQAFVSGNCGSTRARRFSYDSLGRLRAAANPEVGPVSSNSVFYLYDSNGNLTYKEDARYSTSFTYDALDRLTAKSSTPVSDAPAMTAVTYCYDDAVTCGDAAVANSKGRLIKAANGAGSTRFNEYDVMGRVKSSTQVIADAGGGTHNFAYGYDLAGNLTSMTYPSGFVVQTGYDTAGRVSNVRDGATQARYGEVAEYAEHGAIKTLKLGGVLGQDGVTTESWAYNNRLQPTETLLRKAGSSLNSLRLQYFYCVGQAMTCTSNNGNMRSQSIGHDAVGTEAAWSSLQGYDYDALNRLTVFTEGGKTETNQYDSWGNRWSTLDVSNGFPDSPLRPTASSWFSPSNNRMSGEGRYDEVGNQKQFDPFTLTYDAEGHVVSASSSGNGSASYAYDADGRRVKKTVVSAAGVTKITAFAYDAFGQLAAEYGASTDPPGIQFQTPDHLGSTRVVTDAAGDIVRRHDYRPFGEDLSTVNGRSAKYGDRQNVLRFTGKERDAETGLDWMKTRYFSGAQGRFTSPDKPFADQFPEDPQSWNLYSYVRNNPLKMVDEDGQSATLIGALGGGIIGGAVAAWRGESVWKGAASGAVAGALAGAVIDTGGAALGVYGAAAAGGALGGVGGGVVGRALNGQETTVQDVAVDAALGAAGGVAGAAAGKAVVAVGQRIAGPSAALETLRPGPYASESVPATGPRVTPAQAQQLRGEPCRGT